MLSYLFAFIVFIGTRIVLLGELNKYIIVLVPLTCGIVFFLVLKKQILTYDYNVIVREPNLRKWYFESLKYAIYIQALCNIAINYIFNLDLTYISVVNTLYPVAAIYTVFLSPVLEEIVFRKWMFGHLHTKLGFWSSAIISSFLFSFLHFNLSASIGMFLTGVLFCYFYKKSQSLMVTISAHITLNFLVLIAMTLRS
ncbi:CPBP family intramembrane glutamic endopeptidase [Paenibacillus swuensis]|uniref:CPBP family intramembrane glutamic endopeptidase n=1 Tax=Paenibacillus swuensis TaxID=1178515 RepID=UPI00083844EE|nr:type II CAAX endopeptidase family protein [Paenibacillus swuensis]